MDDKILSNLFSFSENNNDNNDKIPTCAEIFDRLVLCGKPSLQYKSIYKTGKIEECSLWWNDYNKCMKSKFIKDDDKKKELLLSMNCMQPNPKPNNVWEFKKKPTWE